MVQVDPAITVVARLRAETAEQAGDAIDTLITRYPSVRLLVGAGAATVVLALEERQGWDPELAIYAGACTPDIVEAMDAGDDGTSGRIRGCVDTDAAGTGRLAGDILTRLAAGSAVPEINEVQVIPYEPGLR